jgi:mRNA interferase MazF
MIRGEIYLADLEPTLGAEANKARPVILVGNNPSLIAAKRANRGVVTVIPCTSNADSRGPMHVVVLPTKLNGLTVPSKAQAEQIRSIDVARLLKRVGKLGVNDLAGVDAAIRYHLDLA